MGSRFLVGEGLQYSALGCMVSGVGLWSGVNVTGACDKSVAYSSRGCGTVMLKTCSILRQGVIKSLGPELLDKRFLVPSRDETALLNSVKTAFRVYYSIKDHDEPVKDIQIAASCCQIPAFSVNFKLLLDTLLHKSLS